MQNKTTPKPLVTPILGGIRERSQPAYVARDLERIVVICFGDPFWFRRMNYFLHRQQNIRNKQHMAYSQNTEYAFLWESKGGKGARENRAWSAKLLGHSTRQWSQATSAKSVAFVRICETIIRVFLNPYITKGAVRTGSRGGKYQGVPGDFNFATGREIINEIKKEDAMMISLFSIVVHLFSSQFYHLF